MPTKPKLRAIAARPLLAGQTAVRRTRIANGTAVLAPEGDGNSWWGRRFAEVLALHLDDLGGTDLLSESQISLARRATAHEVTLEGMEAAMSAGETVDLDQYSRLTGTLGRTLERLGISRVPRATEVNPIIDHFAKPASRSAA